MTDLKITVKQVNTYVDGKPLIEVKMYVKQLDKYVLAHDGRYFNELSALSQILTVWGGLYDT